MCFPEELCAAQVLASSEKPNENGATGQDMEAPSGHRTIRQPFRLVVHYSQSIEQARQQSWDEVPEAYAPSALRQ